VNKEMDLVELGSVTVGSIMILTMMALIATEGITYKMKMKSTNKNIPSKTITAIDTEWNVVRLPIKPN
jgi:hypothetical protein